LLAAYEESAGDVVALLPSGSQMLELGSEPGRDALLFEASEVRVRRTDGAQAFVERLRASGYRLMCSM
jgi:hypothetical protein